MTNQRTTTPTTPTSGQQGRTDDLLAPGADAKDGARGFEATPDALQTGMENITRQQGGAQPEGQQQSTSTASAPPADQDRRTT